MSRRKAKWSKAAKRAAANRMKAYWRKRKRSVAEVRAEQELKRRPKAPRVEPPPPKASVTMFLTGPEQEGDVESYDIQSWGELFDLILGLEQSGNVWIRNIIVTVNRRA